MTALVLAAASAGAALGCNALSLSASSFGDSPGLGGDSSAQDGSAGLGPNLGGLDGSATDAGAASPYKNNPLCFAKASNTTCDPQEDNTAKDGGTDQVCRSLLAKDAGSNADAGHDAVSSYACHVQRTTDGGAAAVCLPEGDSKEVCLAQSACFAGHECVGGDKGHCRRYCCKPNVCEPTSFCDVQQIFQSDVMVPVCMPVRLCELLGPGSCPGQTCGIVDEAKGLTSCLDVGPRGEGDECETDHCGKDLACLGTLGSRKCFKLCDTTGLTAYQCPSNQRCLTNGVTFQGANVGVCGT